jgi:hypothetical protein
MSVLKIINRTAETTNAADCIGGTFLQSLPVTPALVLIGGHCSTFKVG